MTLLTQTESWDIFSPQFLMLAAGFLCVLFSVGMLARRALIASKETSKFSKIATASTFRSMGQARWAPTALMAAYFLALILIPVTIVLAERFTYYPTYELRNVHVDQKIDSEDLGRAGFHYWMTYQSQTIGHIHFLATFCPDYTPQFEPGSTLKLLRYEDRGACWGLRSDSAGYLIVRDQYGQAIKTP